MRARQLTSIILASCFLATALLLPGCRNRSTAFVIALSDNISTLDPIGSPTVDAASERVRVLMFNSLVRKNANFDYVNELASDIKRADDGLSYTFTLHDGVKFHDGKPLTSADVKYTLDTLLTSNSGKSASFFDSSSGSKQPYISQVSAPDARTVVIQLTKPWLQLLPNLVPVAIIPQGSAGSQGEKPLGSGPYKFISFNKSQQILELQANPAYWEGAPKIESIRVRVIGDANALQAEFKSGRVDLAPLPSNLTADAFKSLAQDANLKVVPFTGANVYHITFNVQSAPLNDVRVRQAIAYAIDRESIIRDLLSGQAQLAHSVLPEGSWAFNAGQKYSYDPAKAKKLLDEAGFRDPDGDGPKMRFSKEIVFKIASNSVNIRNYAGVIQNSLKQVGVPVSIETAESNTLRDQVRMGQFQMTTSSWIGGNQDPIFLKDLFATSEIPTQERASRNRSRYSNAEFDRIIEEAVNTADKQKAAPLYAKAQEIISRDLPLFPLWYPANMVVARRNVENIQVDGSGDWGFIRNLTVTK